MESKRDQVGKKKNPRASANLLSALTFSWTVPVFLEGLKRELTEDDIPETLKEHTSKRLGDLIEKEWKKEVLKAREQKRNPRFLSVIIRAFGFRLALLGTVLFIVEGILRTAQPMVLGALLSYFSQPDNAEERTSKETAFMYAAGVVLCSLLTIVLYHPYMLSILNIGMKVRVATCSLIYRQALKLKKRDLEHTTAGQVLNLISNDVNRFDICFIFIHGLWVGPIQTAIVAYLMYDIMGIAVFVGLTAIFLAIPFQSWLGKKTSSLRLKTAVRTDERVRLMNEIISGIQVIKMYAWEKPFAALVEFARRKEIKEITKSLYIKGIMLSFVLFHGRVAVFFTVLSYVLMGNTIDAKKVFVMISFYNTLRHTMTIIFPQGIAQVAEGLISVKRIQAFLMLTADRIQAPTSSKLKEKGKYEMQKDGIKTISNEFYKHNTNKSEKIGVFIKNATAKWSESSHENTLSNITVDISPGVLTAVVGPVGSGKTSLFNTILGELSLTSGSIEVNGRVSYASQEPWLFQGSVQQNILFGLDYNRERYRKVVKVCCLKTDFEQFPHGDKTIVGERGVSLSGGQRARINLARAVYKQADIYILDDPLSAVDTHVGKHLFEDCIQGYLKEKTVILVTHQLQYLNSINQIMLLENGSVKCLGDFNTLQNSGFDFTKLLNSSEKEEKEVEKKIEEAPLQIPSLTTRRQSSTLSVASSYFDDPLNPGSSPQIIAEARSKGSVNLKVYKDYLKSAGGCCIAFSVFVLCALAQILATGGDYWITYWVNVEEYSQRTNDNGSFVNVENLNNLTTGITSNNGSTSAMIPPPYSIIVSRDICIYVFAALTITTIIVTFIRSITFAKMCMKASINLHNRMFTSITRATMWFFNNNPSGRILNRFSKDIGAIDELLPSSLVDVIQISVSLLAIITVVASINPSLLIPTCVAAVMFYYLRKLYLSTSQSVKRLEGTSRSPVFGHMNASLQGLATIRAFEAENILVKEFDNHQDLHSSTWYLFIGLTRAFGFWMDLICLLYIAFVTLSFLVLEADYYGGNVGLAITQAIGLTGMVQWGMRQSAELENQMTSVERVLEYTDLESEPALESSPDKKPRESWPENGKIEFSQVFLRYSAAEPWVLKNLNFTIHPEQKIGIVGRTGAGKSSLISALFRLSEIDGNIIIDGIETGSIGLHDLRSKISIIPQEPVLFSGTLRKNLDPFDNHSDETLWSALEEVELKELAKEMSGGLQAQITEGGSNLSVGQRQLVCLARAIVRRNKILILDEATANVDLQTDSLIQQTIRKKFFNCTVLTVAHRLNTVMDSDKILVMDGGYLVEFDHPHVLLQDDKSILYSMVEQTGEATEEVLKRIARESYETHRTQRDGNTDENTVRRFV